MSLYPKRNVQAPCRFDPSEFVPGANNKYTAGREIDPGHSVESEADRYLEVVPIDEEFIVEDTPGEESEGEWESEEDESEGEWESEEDESEGEWDSEEDESEGEWDSEEDKSEGEEGAGGFWDSHEHPLPENVYIFNLEGGTLNYCSYVKKINEEYVVTLSDWLDECPDNIHNDHEWDANMVGKLKNVVLPENRQLEYITGDLAIETGWRNVQLPMNIVDFDEE